MNSRLLIVALLALIVSGCGNKAKDGLPETYCSLKLNQTEQEAVDAIKGMGGDNVEAYDVDHYDGEHKRYIQASGEIYGLGDIWWDYVKCEVDANGLVKFIRFQKSGGLSPKDEMMMIVYLKETFGEPFHFIPNKIDGDATLYGEKYKDKIGVFTNKSDGEYPFFATSLLRIDKPNSK